MHDAGGDRRDVRLLRDLRRGEPGRALPGTGPSKLDGRRRAWREWDRERQRRHRLLVKLKPAEIASPETDSLDLGKSILNLLGGMHLKSERSMARLEEAEELVRQLARGQEAGRGSNSDR
jgi:hypothetical protein